MFSIHRNCPGSLHFNNDFKYCDYPELAGCEECEIPITTDISFEDTTTELPSTIDEWNVVEN